MGHDAKESILRLDLSLIVWLAKRYGQISRINATPTQSKILITILTAMLVILQLNDGLERAWNKGRVAHPETCIRLNLLMKNPFIK